MRSCMRVLTTVAIVLSLTTGHALGQARSPGQAESTFAPAAVNPAATPGQPAPGTGVPAAQPVAPAGQRTPRYDRRQPAQAAAVRDGRVYYTRPQPSVPTLLIPSAALKPDQLAQIHEDMQIMSRILDKALGAGTPATYAYGDAQYPGYPAEQFTSAADTFRTLLAGPAKCMEAIYLEGFGALFITRVDFPLAPVKTDQAPPEQAEESVWERAKQELHGQKPAWAGIRASGYNHIYGGGSRAKEYDAEKVEQLQKKLLETLEHASNIRGLKAEDSVAVAVLGSEVKGPLLAGYILMAQTGEARSVTRYSSGGTTTRPTALTIHVKKSDVDAFAQDELSFDALRKKATILAY